MDHLWLDAISASFGYSSYWLTYTLLLILWTAMYYKCIGVDVDSSLKKVLLCSNCMLSKTAVQVFLLVVFVLCLCTLGITLAQQYGSFFPQHDIVLWFMNCIGFLIVVVFIIYVILFSMFIFLTYILFRTGYFVYSRMKGLMMGITDTDNMLPKLKWTIVVVCVFNLASTLIFVFGALGSLPSLQIIPCMIILAI